MRDMKVTGISIIVATGVLLAAVGLWFGSNRLFVPATDPIALESLSVETGAIASAQTTTPSVRLEESALAQASTTNLKGTTKAAANWQGKLRVGNGSEHPVRLALLMQTTDPAADGSYENPAHWDFAPGEGSNEGLVLSLPKRGLKLKQGDVLVAFAQDGSRRYWGPYVIGETPMPSWNAKGVEWQLLLEP